jgi:hypothetical protein
MSLPSDSKQDKVDQENLRQLVINETGVEDPCPAFINSVLASLEDRKQVENLDDATDASEKYPIALDTAAAQYPNPDYTVESLAGLDPDDPLAKQIVQALMGIEDASPGLVQDIMREAGLPIGRSGAPSPEPSDCKIFAEDYTFICSCEVEDTPIDHCPHTEGDVMVLTHEPGVNDFGAGGLQRHNRDRSSVSPIVVVPISPQDRVACKAEWDSLVMFQPNGLVSLQMLKDEGLFTEALLDRLPPGFHTTVTGLARAMEDIETMGGMDEDVVVYALGVRGGRPGGHPGAVIYAEELVPYVKEGEAGYDGEFWDGIEEMRRENNRTGIVDLVAWAAV